MLYFSEPEPEVPGVCVKDCSGKPNGDYQSCTTCKGFITCSNNVLYNMPCPANTVWDDVVKRCEWVSTTCKSSTTSTQRPVTSKVAFHYISPQQLCSPYCSLTPGQQLSSLYIRFKVLKQAVSTNFGKFILSS